MGQDVRMGMGMMVFCSFLWFLFLVEGDGKDDCEGL